MASRSEQQLIVTVDDEGQTTLEPDTRKPDVVPTYIQDRIFTPAPEVMPGQTSM